MTVVTLRPSAGPVLRPTAGPVLRPTAGPVRLTRRGRLVVGGLALAVAALAALLLSLAASGGALAASHGAASHGAAGTGYQGMRQVVVQPGQTLWSIAAAAEPSENLWAVVQQIINVNALSGAGIQTGQLLWVPKT